VNEFCDDWGETVFLFYYIESEDDINNALSELIIVFQEQALGVCYSIYIADLALLLLIDLLHSKHYLCNELMTYPIFSPSALILYIKLYYYYIHVFTFK